METASEKARRAQKCANFVVQKNGCYIATAARTILQAAPEVCSFQIRFHHLDEVKPGDMSRRDDASGGTPIWCPSGTVTGHQ
jgi:hypothetical protein